MKPTRKPSRCYSTNVSAHLESPAEKIAKFKEARESRRTLLTASHQYIIEVLASALCLEDSEAEEFVLDAPSLALFDDFFAKGGAQAIAFAYQESKVPGIECGRTFPGAEGAKMLRLILANIKKTIFTGRCFFFTRSNVDSAISAKTIHQEISFFELDASGGVLKGQGDLLSKIYLPAVCANADWGILTNTEEEEKIKQDFSSAISNHINFLEEAQMMMESIKLSKASGIDFSRFVTVEDMKAAGEDVNMMRKYEKVLMMWYKEIDQVLTKSDQIRKENEASGILIEMKHWKKMCAEFSSVIAQTKGAEFKAVLNFLSANASKKIKVWQDLEIRLMEHLNEAKDSVKLLSILEKNCQPLYNFDPLVMAKSLQLISDCIFAMGYVSKFCSTPERTTLLFIKVTNLMLTGCIAYITDSGSSPIWEQETEVIIKKIQNCMYLLREYESSFYKTREQALKQMAAGKSIEVSGKPIFGKFKRFCQRLEKISQLMTTVKTFSSLSHSSIEGMDFLAERFENIYINVKKDQETMLDHGKKTFDDEFAEFTSQMNNLVLHLKDFMSSSISKKRSFHHALTHLQRFENLHIPCLQGEIAKNYNLILKRFVSELERVKKHYESNREDPPLCRNMPPVAGRIRWVRNLLNKIQEPISNIERNSDILTTTADKEVVQMYHKTAAEFVKFQTRLHRAWLKDVSELRDKLQLAHPKMQELLVNLAPKIREVSRETKLMKKMGLDVSEQAVWITSKAAQL